MSLPYMTSPGNIGRALDGIRAAAVPERISQDFVKTILKIPGGSGDQMTSFLKKLGFSGPDGVPNDLYRRFRNPASSKSAVAEAVRIAYAPLFVRNEYMYKLGDKDLVGLIVEETGQASNSNAVKLVLSCIKHLKSEADFESVPQQAYELVSATARIDTTPPSGGDELPPKKFGLNLGYTINLNLPATSDPSVFDAIFKSIKTHLLSDLDG